MVQFLVKDLTTGAILLRGENKNDVYYVSHSGSPSLNLTQKPDISSWHQRLGHPYSQVLKSIIVSNKLVNKFPSSVSFDCNSCLWIKNLLHELAIPISSVPVIYCDNTGAQYLCCNPVLDSIMKHISLDYHLGTSFC